MSVSVKSPKPEIKEPTAINITTILDHPIVKKRVNELNFTEEQELKMILRFKWISEAKGAKCNKENLSGIRVKQPKCRLITFLVIFLIFSLPFFICSFIYIKILICWLI